METKMYKVLISGKTIKILKENVKTADLDQEDHSDGQVYLLSEHQLLLLKMEGFSEEF